ncbi:MAG: hypothetical protein ACRC8H_01525 [Edwardsiella tarda]
MRLVLPLHTVVLPEVNTPGSSGALLHSMVRESVMVLQPLAPVSVSVAVVEPLAVEGVKVASAGSGFCVQLPLAPDQVAVPLYDPLAEAPES